MTARLCFLIYLEKVSEMFIVECLRILLIPKSSSVILSIVIPWILMYEEDKSRTLKPSQWPRRIRCAKTFAMTLNFYRWFSLLVSQKFALNLIFYYLYSRYSGVSDLFYSSSFIFFLLVFIILYFWLEIGEFIFLYVDFTLSQFCCPFIYFILCRFSSISLCLLVAIFQLLFLWYSSRGTLLLLSGFPQGLSYLIL